VLRAGTEIPSTRDLGERLGINPMTVSKAYALLEQEGVLERRPGLALMVRGAANGRAASAHREKQDELAQRELERLLRPAAIAARQLGVPAKDAIELFKRVLRAPGDEA
jgi:GntR family transcriptional regulator